MTIATDLDAAIAALPDQRGVRIRMGEPAEKALRAVMFHASGIKMDLLKRYGSIPIEVMPRTPAPGFDDGDRFDGWELVR